MQTLSSSQVSPEVPINENFDTLGHVAVYGKAPATTTGLTWGYYGGRWGGYAVNAGTLTLTNAADNYVVAAKSDGAISVSTSTANWSNTTDYARAYKITTAGSVVTAVEDHRAGPSGVHGGVVSGSGSSIGRHAVPVLAGSIQPSVSSGCAALEAVAIASGQPDVVSLNFDATTQEYAQFSIPMPSSWDEGVVTFMAHWSHAATTTNFGVAWDLQAVAVGNDDTMAASFGTAQVVTDTGGTTNDMYTTAESSAITVAGSPAAGDVVFFRISRVTGNGADNMAIDARLHAITLFINTAAGTDS